jgi:hypothetical protein
MASFDEFPDTKTVGPGTEQVFKAHLFHRKFFEFSFSRLLRPTTTFTHGRLF